MPASLQPAPVDPGEVARQRRVEHGDWQTPALLAEGVAAVVAALEPGVQSVLEPTCGKGSFLLAARQVFPTARLVGYELSAEHAVEARRALRGSGASVEVADFFETPWDEVIGGLPEPLVILGNPPWVTSAALGVLSGKNLPCKSNFKRATGLDALTGKSNFDISEWMIRRLVEAARGRRFTLAMLCKASVTRRLIERAAVERWGLSGSVRRVDAHAHFSAAVSAVLVVLRGEGHAPAATGPRWDVYPSLGALTPTSRMGVVAGRAVRDVDTQERTALLEAGAAAPPRVWRSGVKHDLARVMELTQRGDGLENGLGEHVELEPAHVYPLLKGSDLGTERARALRYVLVTQAALGVDTAVLAESSPLTWRYLERHRAAFDARKSRIYRGQPPYAMFGVGPYSFAPYKVAISGLHKRLVFRVVGPREGRPVLLDDTSYFLPFDDEATARAVASLLGTERAREFFEARVFWDDKRPINKAVLSALSLEALAERIADDGLRASPL